MDLVVRLLFSCMIRFWSRCFANLTAPSLACSIINREGKLIIEKWQVKLGGEQDLTRFSSSQRWASRTSRSPSASPTPSALKISLKMICLSVLWLDYLKIRKALAQSIAGGTTHELAWDRYLFDQEQAQFGDEGYNCQGH